MNPGVANFDAVFTNMFGCLSNFDFVQVRTFRLHHLFFLLQFKVENAGKRAAAHLMASCERGALDAGALYAAEIRGP